MNKAIFLDRDGVVNSVIPGKYVTKWEEFHFLSGVAEAIKRFQEMGFLVILVTNQFGIGRGFATMKDVQNIHNRMQKELQKQGACLDAIYFCPDESKNRKPGLGMFLKAIGEWNIDIRNSYVIGDSEADLIAAHKLGCKFIMVKSKLSPVIVNSLLEASEIIQEKGEKL